MEETFQTYPWAQTLTGLALLVLAAVVANWITKQIVVRVLQRAIAASPLRGESRHIGRAVTHLSNVVPAIVIQSGIEVIAGVPERLEVLIQSLAAAFIIFTVARTVSDLADLLNDTYEQRPAAAEKPIKGYIQVAKILVYGTAAFLMVASLTGQSPLLLLSGLGALAAVLMLVFRDTILSLVASVQLRSNDMLRVGDWIDMPQLNADGYVIDIALHTVKVQNWDKTITTIPTHRLISESYRNWRSMFEGGGRRIMRSFYIDQTTIQFLSSEDWQALHCFALLRPYLDLKQAELDEWNAKHAAGDEHQVNKRRPTNIGTFRAYVTAYIKAHPGIAQNMLLLVRQLAPEDRGLPLQIYCFTNTTAWVEYEAIQADIFDHLLSILPDFGLRAFQQPSGYDVTRLAGTALTEVRARLPSST